MVLFCRLWIALVSFRRERGLMAFSPFLKLLIAHSASLDRRERMRVGERFRFGRTRRERRSLLCRLHCLPPFAKTAKDGAATVGLCRRKAGPAPSKRPTSRKAREVGHPPFCPLPIPAKERYTWPLEMCATRPSKDSFDRYGAGAAFAPMPSAKPVR